jgi:hypothetical protein
MSEFTKDIGKAAIAISLLYVLTVTLAVIFDSVSFGKSLICLLENVQN